MGERRVKGKGRLFRAWASRAALCALCGLLVFSAAPAGQSFWTKAYALSGFRGPQGEAGLRLHVIDVGKADALLLECEGHAALLDGGTSASGDRVVDYLLRLGIESLDYAIASHPDSDHTGGLSQVLEEVPVGELVVYPWPEAMRRTLEYRALEDAARSSAVPVRQVRPGESFSLGGTKLEVLGPLRDMREPTIAPWCCGWTIWDFLLCFAEILNTKRSWIWSNPARIWTPTCSRWPIMAARAPAHSVFWKRFLPHMRQFPWGRITATCPGRRLFSALKAWERRFTEPIPMGTWYSPGTGKNCPFGVNFTTQWKGQKRSHETACHRPFRGQICHLHR